jgi:predicted N-acetyltransferase YhbS
MAIQTTGYSIQKMVIKIATDPDEFLGIHRLNYQTFVEEIQQHAANEEKILIDKYHNKNQYLIAKKEDKVIGMVCFNHERPFSLDSKVDHLDAFLPPYHQLAEIRLLAVTPQERKGRLAHQLLHHLFNVLISMRTDAAIISGSTTQLKLYTHIGFVPFGPLVGKEGAQFQPMYITLKQVSNEFSH